ncbi:BspA family leucine-rich repeat surface protein [Enterococcus gilvus]|uniref:BspA family leucine-rich repeat surface protein n=1 Tax=Enterococcus gilvus TaxID=160453 RepID=UPI003ED88F67
MKKYIFFFLIILLINLCFSRNYHTATIQNEDVSSAEAKVSPSKEQNLDTSKVIRNSSNNKDTYTNNTNSVEDHNPGGIMLKMSDSSAQKGIDISTDYSNSSDPHSFKGGKIGFTITGNFDTSQTSAIAQGHLATWGLAFMGILNLPDYIQSDQIMTGVEQAYKNDPKDFYACVYKKDGTVGDTISLNDKTLSVYDGHDHDQKDQHKVAVTVRGPSMDSGIWSTVWDIYTSSAYDKKNTKIALHFSVDVSSAMKAGLPDSFDNSPSKELTSERLPPASDNNLKFSFQFYDCNQVSNEVPSWKVWSATPEIHITTGEEEKPNFQSETDGLATWSDYLSPWDKEGEYNSSSPPFIEVNGINTSLSGDYLKPVIDWNSRKDGPVVNSDDFRNLLLTRFGRAVNIIDKTEDSKAKINIQENTEKSSLKNYYKNNYTFSGIDNSGNQLNSVPFTINSETEVPVIQSGEATSSLIEMGHKTEIKLNILARNVRKLAIFGSTSLSDNYQDLGEKDLSSEENDVVTITVDASQLVDFYKPGDKRSLYIKVCDSEDTSKGMSNVQEVTINLAKWGTAPYNWDASSGTLTVGAGDLQDTNKAPWKLSSPVMQAPDIRTIDFEDSVTAPVDSSDLFSGLSSLEKFINLPKLNTSSVTDMSRMFYSDSSLKDLVLSQFNTSRVLNMRSMFNVIGTTKLDLSSFVTSSVQDMGWMFADSPALESVTFPSTFTTDQVQDMTGMFRRTNIITLDLTKFNNNLVPAGNMGSMFKNMTKLKSLTLGKNFSFKTTDVGLPAPPNNADYNGKWRNISSGTPQKPLGKNLWTADEFMKTYNGPSDEDTYVWQPTGMYIDAVADTFSFPKVHISGKEQTVTPNRNAHLTLTDALPKNASGTQVVVSYETAEDEWQKAGLSLKVSPTTTQTYIQTNETQISSDAAPIITQFDESKKPAATLVDLDLAPKLTIPPASLAAKDYSTTIDWTIQQGPS